MQNKEVELEKNNPESDCPPCQSQAPLYIGTFADMAILLMAFFVIVLALSVFSPEQIRTMDSVAASISGVQREIEVFQEATAENLVMEQFRSGQVEPIVFDIIEEERSDQRPREEQLDINQSQSNENTNAYGIVGERLASQIAQGKVITRQVDNRVVVEILAPDAGTDQTEVSASEPGQLDREFIEILLQVATAQSETQEVIEVIDETE